MRTVFVFLFLYCFLSRATEIYPDDHFDYATEINDSDELDRLYKTSIEKSQTLFVRWIGSPENADCLTQAPTWNRVVKAFAHNNHVLFGDVNLAEAASSLKGEPHWPSQFGWPTIRYFNRATGIDGADYKQKITTLKVCDELLDFDRMVDYIEEAGNTVLCALNGKNCNSQEKEYMELVKNKSLDDIVLLRKQVYAMDVNLLRNDLQEWNLRRRRILTQLAKEKEKEQATTGNEL